MKKTLSVLLVIMSLSVYSQEYIPLAREGQHWIIMVYDYQEEDLLYLWEYYMTGDTIINDLEYKTVHKRNLDKSNWYSPPFTGEEDYYPVGAVRDNMSDRKAYAVLFENYISDFCPVNADYLLYDFSLSINDTVDFCSFIGWDDTNLISEIYDDIRYDQNTIVFNSSEHDYLEGIGSPFGLFENILIMNKKSRFASNPELIYYCPSNDCDVILGDNIIKSIKLLNFYPNPANTQITFDLPSITKESLLHIIDPFGKTIDEFHLKTGQSQLKWNCNNISSGVYFYQTEIDGINYSGKILIQ